MQLDLDDKEVELVRDLLDWWIEGMPEATTAVEQDRSLNTPEELLEMVSGMHEQFNRAVTLRQKLRPAEVSNVAT